MKLAITVWKQRISPVFDTATQLLLLDLSAGQVVDERVVAVHESPFATVLELRQKEKIALLLCGALCHQGEKRLQSGGLEVLPFLSGDVEQIVQSLLAGSDLSFFAMPGCRRQCCCRQRQKIYQRKRHGNICGG